MAEINTALLKQTLEYIKDNPETWDQANWCGTSQCFAGWAITLAGMRASLLTETVAVDDMPAGLASAVDPDIEKLTVREAAVLALDIADAELVEYLDGEPNVMEAASVLFYSGNTLEDLERHVAELCDEASAATA